MITISPGHFGKRSGAVSLLDEAVEEKKVAQAVAQELRKLGVTVHFVEDTVSKNQQQNIRYLVGAHNQTVRELDVSVHFNVVAGVRAEGIGTEVLYVNPVVQPLAQQLSAAIASVLAGQVQTLPFSSDALTSRVLEMWADEPAVIRQLERGVADGVFQDVWLQRAKVGTLSIHDYLALCALQLKNISKSCNLFEACPTNYIEE